MLWSIMQPLGMTLLIAIVFGRIFKIEIREYAPYILSGIIIWEFIMGSAVTGSLSFVQADAYIKQCRHPLAIYTLRSVLTNLMVLALASISLYLWVIVAMPQNFHWSWLATLTIYPLLLVIAWPLSTLLAYIAVRFRDVPHALGLIFQALWFVSPVYFEAKLFRGGGMSFLVDYNPIYHVLQIFRAPLLNSEFPTFENYLYCIGTGLAFTALAWIVGRKAEPRVIFYL